MEAEPGNLQNDFFNAARRDRTPVTIYLENGKRLVGRIKSFDKFTVLLESQYGEQIVFKHAISTVSTGERHHHDEHEAESRGRQEAPPVGGMKRS